MKIFSQINNIKSVVRNYFYFVPFIELGTAVAGDTAMERERYDRIRFHRSHTGTSAMGPRKSTHSAACTHAGVGLLYR